MTGISGRLRLRQKVWDRHLDLREGRIAFVSSTHPAERPAAWLARREVLPETELRGALARSLLGRGRLTELACDLAEEEQQMIRAQLEDLAYHIVSRILLGGSVDFEFDPHYPVPGPPALNLDLDPQTLVLEAARRTDEGPRLMDPPDTTALPFTGEAFESIFWEILEHALPVPVDVDGPTLSRVHTVVRDVIGTLAQWLERSPGLVPVPAPQADSIQDALSEHRAPRLLGLPHVVWNLQTLAAALPTGEQPGPAGLADLEAFATDHDLWVEVSTAPLLGRVFQARIDPVVERLTLDLAHVAGAAAGPLDLDPVTIELGAHLLVVPTDLFLYVLATVPVPLEAVRRTVLERLPHRLGHALAARAGFPPELAPLFRAGLPTPVTVALHLARAVVSGGALIPPLVDDDATLVDLTGSKKMRAALKAVREAAVEAGCEVG